MAFIDPHIGFDTIELWGYISIDDTRIDTKYTNLINNVNGCATFYKRIDENLKTNGIHLGRVVRQGDPNSPKLFTLTLKSVFKQLVWKKKLQHSQPFKSRRWHCLKKNKIEEQKSIIKMNQNKILSNILNNIIDNITIENVVNHIYLGHTAKLGKEH